MSFSFTPPPTSVIIDGMEYKINTDFRVWIEIEELLKSNSVPPQKRLAECLILAYPKLPPNPKSALEELLRFYSMGNTPPNQEDRSPALPSAPVCDLRADFTYIYGSFMECYNIDLCNTALHWWKFRALMQCLDENCKFAKIISYRSINPQSIADRNQRQFCMRMKKLYALPDPRTDEEKEMAQNETMSTLF